MPSPTSPEGDLPLAQTTHPHNIDMPVTVERVTIMVKENVMPVYTRVTSEGPIRKATSDVPVVMVLPNDQALENMTLHESLVAIIDAQDIFPLPHTILIPVEEKE